MQYYEALEIGKDATTAEILAAYRAQALRLHPQRNPGTSPDRFLTITEAYLVLSAPELRAAFDRFGEPGVRHLTSQNVKGTQKLTFDGQSYCNLEKALSTFEQVFTTTDPFAASFDQGFSAFGAAPGLDETKWRPRPERRRKDDDLFVDLELNLEELYFGCVKKRKITRRAMNSDQTFTQREEVVEIQVKSGWREGTQIRFRELGDEAPGVVPSDVVFVVKEKPHQVFKRKGDDLVVQLKISLIQALGGFTTEVNTLDGRALHAEITEIVQPGAMKTVHGEGMPRPGGGKGNLMIQFEVEFPKHIPEHSRKQLKEILAQCE